MFQIRFEKINMPNSKPMVLPIYYVRDCLSILPSRVSVLAISTAFYGFQRTKMAPDGLRKHIKGGKLLFSQIWQNQIVLLGHTQVRSATHFPVLAKDIILCKFRCCRKMPYIIIKILQRTNVTKNVADCSFLRGRDCQQNLNKFLIISQK